jgi:hypothetical protein
MEGYSKLLQGLVPTAAAIAFGWLLNQAGQWFRARQEDKKSLKLILFNLLDTYSLFLSSDLDNIAEAVTTKVLTRVPESQLTAAETGKISAALSEVFTSILKPKFFQDLKVIEANYQSSIRTLASIDPLLAFHLNGKTNILDRFETLAEMLGQIKFDDVGTDDLQRGSRQIIAMLKPEMLEQTFADLEKTIKTIAGKINLIVRIKSKKTINGLRVSSVWADEKTVDIMIHNLQPYFDSLGLKTLQTDR